VKLYDGRGKRFKELIDPKVIMKENRLKITEVIPRHARAKWFSIWIRGGTEFVLAMGLLGILSDTLHYIFYMEHYLYSDEIFEYLLRLIVVGFLFGGLCVLIDRRRTWKSKAVAIRTLAAIGFCPNCGYIICDTPPELDGCTPCSECGHAWRVEPVDS